MDEQALSLMEILKVGGFAGVISALFSAGIKEIFESRNRIRKAKSLGLLLADILEGYFLACRSWIYDIEVHKSSRGHAGDNRVGLPDAPIFPDHGDSWAYFPPELVSKLRRLLRSISETRDGIHINLDHDYDPDGPDPRYSLEALYATALAAAVLASEIRTRLNLPRNDDLEVSQMVADQADFLRDLKQKDERRSIRP